MMSYYEPDNADRATWALTGLIAYANENRACEVDWERHGGTLSETDEVIRDFFCDLRHFAASRGISTELLTEYFVGSEEVYNEEVLDEETDDEPEGANEE